MRRDHFLVERRRQRLLAFVGCFFVAVLVGRGVQAHTRSTSYSTWIVDGTRAEVTLKVSLRDLTSLPWLAGVAPTALSDSQTKALQMSLALRDDDHACAPTGFPERLPAAQGWVRLRWEVVCETPPREIASSLFPTLAAHVHLVALSDDTAVLTQRTPRVALSRSDDGALALLDARGSSSVSSFVRLGVEHILTGWDHIVFVLLLIVVASRFTVVLGLVTGFTVGHSITLALAAQRIVLAFPRPVEAAIAASILIVAVENVWVASEQRRVWLPGVVCVMFAAVAVFANMASFWGIVLFSVAYFALVGRRAGWSARLRWPLACVFGLLHGFGFARVLATPGSNDTASVASLFGFNVGVELGQAVVVLLAWPVIVLLRRRGLERGVVLAGSCLAAAVGTYALVARAFG